MSHYSMRVFWSVEDEMFVAICPALGGISAFGATAQEAVVELEQAIRLTLETYSSEGWSVPEPDILEEQSGQFRLRLPRSLHAWLSHEAERQGVSLNTLTTTILAQAKGTTETCLTFTREIEATLNSLRSVLVSAMRTAIVEAVAHSSSSKTEILVPSKSQSGTFQTRETLMKAS